MNVLKPHLQTTIFTLLEAKAGQREIARITGIDRKTIDAGGRARLNFTTGNQNVEYKTLDASIRNSYAKHSTATLQKNLYDSYIRAICWASDRIGDSGVVGYGPPRPCTMRLSH